MPCMIIHNILVLLTMNICLLSVRPTSCRFPHVKLSSTVCAVYPLFLSTSQYPETPRRFTTWWRAMACLQETLKTFRSRKGNCISSNVIQRNIYRLLLGNSKFMSFLIYVTFSRKSALTLTPDCLRTDISITVIGGTTVPVCRLLSSCHSRFCIYWITFTRIPSQHLVLTGHSNIVPFIDNRNATYRRSTQSAAVFWQAVH